MNQYSFYYKIESHILGYVAYLKIIIESPLTPQRELQSMRTILSQQTGIDAEEFIPVRKREFRENKNNAVYVSDND